MSRGELVQPSWEQLSFVTKHSSLLPASSALEQGWENITRHCLLWLPSGARYTETIQSFHPLGVKASTPARPLTATGGRNGARKTAVTCLMSRSSTGKENIKLGWGVRGGRWAGETDGHLGYNGIQTKGFGNTGVCHSSWHPSSWHFCALCASQIVDICFSVAKPHPVHCSLPCQSLTDWGLEEIQVLSFQGVKHIQCQPPTQNIPPGSKMQSNARAWLCGINWYLKISFFTRIFPQRSFLCYKWAPRIAHTRQWSCSINGLCGCCLRVLLLSMSLMVTWLKI